MTGLRIADGMVLPESAATQTIAVLGQRGSGKSTTTVVIAEEMFRAGIPWVTIDGKGDWHGIRSSSGGRRPGLPVPVFGGLHGDFPLEHTSGRFLADLIVDENLTCVLDISDFTKGERRRFLVEFCDRLYRRHRQSPQARHIFMAEAHEYVPQQVMKDTAEVKEVAARLVLLGRSFGLGVTLESQRSARLHKDVLSQIGTLVAHRTTAPQDRKAIESWIVEHDVALSLADSLPSLADGEAWLWSPEWLGTTRRIQVRARTTFDSGATPEVGRGARAPGTIADIDAASIKEKMAETIERAKADDPAELRKRIRDLERQLAALEKAGERVVEKPVEVERVVEVHSTPAEVTDALAAIASAVERALKHAGGERRVDRPSAATPTAPQGKPSPPPPVAASQARERQRDVRAPADVDATRAGVTRPQQRILDTLAWFASIGVQPVAKSQLALFADASPKSSAYANNLGSLRTLGLIDYPRGGYVALTVDGGAAANPVADITTHDQLLDALDARLSGPQARIVRALCDVYPDALDKTTLADRTGASPTSSAFANNLGSLRTLGLIDYPERGYVAAQPILFLERT